MKTTIVTVVIIHFILLFFNVVSFVVLPFFVLWDWKFVFIIVPLMSFLANLMYMKSCPLTRLENYLRQQMGMPKIKGFIPHYLGRKKDDIRR